MGAIVGFAVLVVVCTLLSVAGKTIGVNPVRLGVWLVVILSFAVVGFVIYVFVGLQ